VQSVPDPYRALGVPRGASDAEIKAAHRKLAKRYHPDASGGDTNRFLSVQEAYRVLSDPLLRKEWDARHTGPIRASQPVPPKPRTARAARRSASASRVKTGAEEGATRPDADSVPPSARPRSSCAYTWSASEVPWWEEGAAREKKRARARRQRPTGQKPSAGTPEAARAENAQDFDVYNRSSGAAWSMAARAYFRRGDQDLPSRGSFKYQGTQVLTAARARAAAEAEARVAAARAARENAAAAANTSAGAPPAQAAYAYANAGVARDLQSVSKARENFLKRLRAQHWPSLKERLLYALAAWLPVAVLIGYGGFVGTGCDRGALGCTPQIELVQAVLIGAVLLGLVLVPKIAYFGALGTLGIIVSVALAVGALMVLDAPLPLTLEMLAVVGLAGIGGYLLGAGIAIARGGPWRAGQT
jgi:curved DNA-binding protein CbpA